MGRETVAGREVTVREDRGTGYVHPSREGKGPRGGKGYDDYGKGKGKRYDSRDRGRGGGYGGKRRDSRR